MKQTLSFLIFIFFISILSAQSNSENYEIFVKKGDEALVNRSYKEAIQYYFAARGYLPSNKATIDVKVNNALDQIEQLRQTAEKNERTVRVALRKVDKSKSQLALAVAEAEAARDEAEKARQEVEETNIKLAEEKEKLEIALDKVEQAEFQARKALRSARKLIKAFHFYDDKFALAFKDDKFYFIDRNGNKVLKLGEWDQAEQFDSRGFAKVRKEGTERLLDTLGEDFLVAYDISDLNRKVKALDLSEKNLTKVPTKVFRNPQLQVLLLDKNQLKDLPADIQSLRSLQYLDISNNKCTNLPTLTGKLLKLRFLNLSKNDLKKLPPEIGGLKHLEHIDISHNDLADLPDQISNMVKLKSINLSSNAFKSLPVGIKDLTELTTLELNNNVIEKLPTWLKELENIKQLDLSKNRLYKHSINVESLTNLRSLSLMDNDLKQLPLKFVELKYLTTLDLRYNQSLQVRPLEDEMPWCKFVLSNDEFEDNFFEIGYIAFESGNYKEALASFLKDIEDPKSPFSNEYAGLCYYYLKDNKKAVEYLEESHTLRPSRLSTVTYLANIYFEEKNYLKAYEYVVKATNLDNVNSKSWNELSRMALYANKPKEAIKAAQSSLKIDKRDRTIESLLAIGYILNNQWEEANRIYKMWRGQTFFTDGQPQACGQVFINDIMALEGAEISHQDFDKVKNMFRKYVER